MTKKKVPFPEIPLPQGPESFSFDDAWRAEAACLRSGMDGRLWFPDRSRGKGVADALRICAACPVKKDCLEYALTAPERHGIWGGMLEHERRAEIRRREREAAAQEQWNQRAAMRLGPR